VALPLHSDPRNVFSETGMFNDLLKPGSLLLV
jgi:hypothetical protein